jgi:hypothetical protein
MSAPTQAQQKFTSWQNHPITRKLLNSSFYRPYMWSRYTIDMLSLPVTSAMQPILPRRFHAYVIGTMKSGTTSLGRVLGKRYRTAHEPLPRQSCLQTALFRKKEISEPDFINYVLTRDKFLQLELESAWFLADWVHILVEKFPTAKFILPIRDPHSWLRSMVNQELSTNMSVKQSYWKILFDEYFIDDSWKSQDAPLTDIGLHSVSAYLRYWNDHHMKILNTVPKERLMVVKTLELSSKISKICDFLGVASDCFDLTEKIHQNKTHLHHIEVSDYVGQNHINKCIEKSCEPKLLSYFPEMYSL